MRIVRSSRIRTDAAADERAHHAAPQLVGDAALIERLRLELHPDGRRPVSQRLDAENLEWAEHQWAPDRIFFYPRADFADGAEHAIDVLAIGDAEVDDGVRELFAEVCQRRNGAVRKHLNGAFAVANDDRSQVDLLDRPGDAVDAREIADAH